MRASAEQTAATLRWAARHRCVVQCQTASADSAASGYTQDNEENKLIYTDIFQKYTELLESNIEGRLSKTITGFNKASFYALLEARNDELMSDVFDQLLSLGDFDSFKEVMLAYKREVDSGSGGFEIHVSAMKIHTGDRT